jgi:hypothetical protein
LAINGDQRFRRSRVYCLYAILGFPVLIKKSAGEGHTAAQDQNKKPEHKGSDFDLRRLARRFPTVSGGAWA